MADHDVVEHVDVQETSGGDRLGGEMQVIGARRGIEPRVIGWSLIRNDRLSQYFRGSTRPVV